MRDLLLTSKWHTEECPREARAKGFKVMRLANIQLLGDDR
jgi:hypothetical protein